MILSHPGLWAIAQGSLLVGLLWLGNVASVMAQTPGFETQLQLESGSDSRYLLGAGDRLRIDIFDVPEYSGEYQVLSDGYLSLPLVGTLRAEGLTLDQATALISQRLGQILRRPLVTVSLLEARPITLAIAGEVQRPGTYTFETDTTLESPTVTKAIQLAGGITQTANIREIEVRRNSSRVESAGTPQVTTVDLWGLLQNADLQQDLPLRDGDTIYVPTATTLNLDEVTELASTSFSPDVITVNVVGEVGRSGAIQVPPNTPLNQAILAAGGFNTRARRGEVELVRLNPNGTVTQRQIEVDFAQGVNEATNPSLRPHDTVIVGRSGFARFSDVFSSLVPVTGILRLFGL